ncbi:MAG: VCBS repeat-containing protein, partial [Candidatus Omnitrophica bacterium]|nr:VCBS repeat-containing protein [Candidatus Omnitrophota bacterium]
EFVRILDDPMGKVAVETLSGQQVQGPDFGNAYSAAAIEGQKFEDLNFNGSRDPGETGLNGVKIEVYAESSGLIFRASTETHDMDLDGNGSIDPETERGWYRLVFEPDNGSENILREVIPEGYNQTLPNTPRPVATHSQHSSFLPDFPDTEQEGDFETHQILAVDLNKDGAADYLYSGEYDPDASAEPTREVIQVLLNDGNGLFNDPDDQFLSLVALVKHEFETTDRVTGLAAGDFDGDTNIDFAALEANSANLLLYKGDGTGTFTENGTTGRGQQAGPGVLFSGDLDNDGDTDLVAFNEGAVAALLNDGAGNFSVAGSDFGVGSLGAPRDGALTDLNGDGFADLAASQSHFSNDGLFVMLNLGVDGGNVWQGFAEPTFVSYVIETNDFGPVAVGNFDADPDVEIVGGKSDAEVVIMDNDGAGVFSIVKTATAGLDFVSDLDVLDDNMDGNFDIVVVGDEDGFDTLHENGRILRGDGQGNFTLADPFFNFLSNRIQVEEFNRDGIPDIGFHSDRSQAIGFYEFLQPRYTIEADIGDTVKGVDFGNYPLGNR